MYGHYSLHSTRLVQEPVMVRRAKFLATSDPDDFYYVESGEMKEVSEQLWVVYHKRTGLPKYKVVRVP